jgi:hypothetical protein
MHNTNTRNKPHLYRLNANLSCFQKSTLYSGNNSSNNLLPSLTTLKNNRKKYKAAWRKFVHTHFFYYIVELLHVKKIYFVKQYFTLQKLCILVNFCLVPHPTVFVTNLWIHGMYVYMYCVLCMYVRIYANTQNIL